MTQRILGSGFAELVGVESTILRLGIASGPRARPAAVPAQPTAFESHAGSHPAWCRSEHPQPDPPAR